MPESDLTPEDRLLQIVDKKLSAAGQIVAPTRRPASWIKFFFPAGGNIRKLKAVSRLLMAVCTILTVVFVGYYAQMNAAAGRQLLQIQSVPLKDGARPEVSRAGTTQQEGADFAHIVFLLKKRNIFSLVPVATNDGGSVIGDRNEVAEFKLVGILWSDHPQAMIENVQEQKTYLLSQGENLGNFSVKEVQKEKVIIEKNGRVWELM